MLTIEESGELVIVLGFRNGVKTLCLMVKICKDIRNHAYWVATEPWNATGVDVPPFPECRRKVRRIPTCG